MLIEKRPDIEPFTDRNGRAIHFGDSLMWKNREGVTVIATALDYEVYAVDPDDPDEYRHRLMLLLPNGHTAYLFRHQTQWIESFLSEVAQP
jgi:hypothetical protein